MMKPKVLTILLVTVCAIILTTTTFAQGTQSANWSAGQDRAAGDRLSKKRLLKLLTLNDSTQQELSKIISQKGVDFQATPSDERELHDAGASDDLIVAVRSNYR